MIVAAVQPMINIQISRNYTHHDIWGKYLLFYLSKHQAVQTQILKYKIPILTSGRRALNNFTSFIYEDIVFVIDDWDYASPTCYLLNDTNIPKFYLDNNVCILKIQYCLSEKNNYDKIYTQCGIKILPFTMFPTHSFQLENFTWNNYNHKYQYIITGRPWKDRISWIQFAENTTHTQNNLNQIPNEDNGCFYELLKQSKWGLVLRGKGCGSKNRREVEFSSLGMPLALNYIPEYPFDFKPDIDFVFLKSPQDLDKLKDIDPTPFAQRSRFIYNNYFSRNNGIFNSFNLVYKLAKINFDTIKPLNFSSIQPEKDIISITPKKGYNLLNTKKGDIISIQYVSGSWKSWGRSYTRGMVSPDNTNNRGGDRARLTIFHKNNFALEKLAIVPEYTKQKPFSFTVPKDNLHLYFDINDQQGYSRGEVQYIIKSLT